MSVKKPKKVDGCYQTLNDYGLSFELLNSYGKKLITLADKNLPILDIGAGYGVFTLEALKEGFQVIANDLSAKHLQILKESTPIFHREKLFLAEGAFPNDIPLAKKSLGAVYACGVLHYLSPEIFAQSLHQIHEALDDNGLLCLVTTSPYLKGYEKFLPTYEKRYREGELWPGFIENYHTFFTSKDFTNPEPTNIMDCNVLERSLKGANFETVDLGYLSIKGVYSKQYSSGRELSAIIAVKK